MFDGTLGEFIGSNYTIELQENTNPHNVQHSPIPIIYEPNLKKDINRLIKLGALKKIFISQWASPSFIIPNKNETVRFISDFREKNNKKETFSNP